MRYIKIFCKRITDDLKLKELLPIKILFFMQMSTILVLYPYLTIHMRELGIDVEETAIMSAITPVVTILMPPIAGMIADRIGNFKVLLSGFSMVGGIGALLLLYVPIGRVKIDFPQTLVLGLSCSSGNPLELIIPNESLCMRHADNTIDNVSLRLVSCGYLCPTSIDIENVPIDQYTTKFSDQNYETFRSYNVTAEDVAIPTEMRYPDIHQTVKINEKFYSAFRKFGNRSYYFPGRDSFDLSCDRTNSTCEFTKNWKNISNLNVNFLNTKSSLFCQNGFAIYENETITVELNFNSTSILQTERCDKICIATIQRKKLCTNNFKTVDIDPEFTFWTYLAVRVFIAIIGGTAYTMFEGAVIAVLREYKADYGLQRIYASLGGIISSPLSGWLIDYASTGKNYTDFRPVFYLYTILKIISGIMMLFINLEFKAPAQKVVSEVRSILSVELISVFVAVFLLGSAWGYIESFLFWLLQDLGGSKSLMGLTITAGGVIGIPILVISGPLIKKLGHANVIFIGFIAYVIRLLGYSLIYNPWLALIFEALECLTHSLCFTAAVTYAARLSTQKTDTTIQGIFGGLFYGVGKSFGSLVGGYLIKLIGIRSTFQVFSGTTGIAGFVYLGFYHCFMKKRSILNVKKDDGQKENGRKRQDDEEKSKKPDLDSIQIEDNSINDNNSMDYEIVTLPNDEAVITEVAMTNLGYEDTEGNDVNLKNDKNQVETKDNV